MSGYGRVFGKAMTELESVRQKNGKERTKPAAKRRGFVKAVGAGAAALVAVGVARRVLQKPATKARIVIPEERPGSGGSKLLRSGRQKLASVMADSLSPR